MMYTFTFLGFDKPNKAIMLEFVSFNLAFVRLPIETNSLENLLKELVLLSVAIHCTR